jgi:hypothetical protein
LVVHELKDPFLSPKQNPTPDNYKNNNNKRLGTLFLEQQNSGFSWKRKTGCSCRRIWFFDFLRTGWSTHTHTYIYPAFYIYWFFCVEKERTVHYYNYTGGDHRDGLRRAMVCHSGKHT